MRYCIARPYCGTGSVLQNIAVMTEIATSPPFLLNYDCIPSANIRMDTVTENSWRHVSDYNGNRISKPQCVNDMNAALEPAAS